jgi:hypothetical protein
MGLILKYNEQFLWHYLYYLLWIIGVFKNTFMLKHGAMYQNWLLQSPHMGYKITFEKKEFNL